MKTDSSTAAKTTFGADKHFGASAVTWMDR